METPTNMPSIANNAANKGWKSRLRLNEGIDHHIFSLRLSGTLPGEVVRKLRVWRRRGSTIYMQDMGFKPEL